MHSERFCRCVNVGVYQNQVGVGTGCKAGAGYQVFDPKNRFRMYTHTRYLPLDISLLPAEHG